MTVTFFIDENARKQIISSSANCCKIRAKIGGLLKAYLSKLIIDLYGRLVLSENVSCRQFQEMESLFPKFTRQLTLFRILPRYLPRRKLKELILQCYEILS